MNCPQCGQEMKCGNLHSRNYPFWTQQELRFFRSPTDTVEVAPPDDDTTSMFTRAPFPTFPGAWLCRSCGLVVFSGKLLEKRK